ncbi:cupin domain-containing protein [Sporanaerobium hydrogeniformans]|uniref:cupin domain-containing protein n=1 Tax=Sporanaerobium hydrogeniformans TaxID=3072179 RepID=UPI0015D5072E|nr:cupin domain-containing protein [Sporanaerobium hydrogeniformans]
MNFNRRPSTQSTPNITGTRTQGYKIPISPRNSQSASPITQQLKDYGAYPFVVNIDKVTEANQNFRTTLWTGKHLQLTLMSLLPGEEIGLEMHENVDQFFRIEKGKAIIMMGDNSSTPNFQQTVFDDDAFIVPAGTWHNVVNIGVTPLKLYTIYAPPQHPFGTIHPTKADAQAAEKNK